MQNKNEKSLIPKPLLENEQVKRQEQKEQLSKITQAKIANLLSCELKNAFYLYERLPRYFEEQEEEDIKHLKLSGYQVLNEFATSLWQEYHAFYGQLLDAHTNLELANNAGMPVQDEETRKLLEPYPALSTMEVSELEPFAYKTLYLDLLKSADIFAFRTDKDGNVLCNEALAFAQEHQIFTLNLSENPELKSK